MDDPARRSPEPAASERPRGIRDAIYSLGEAASVRLTSQKGPGRFMRIFFKFPVWFTRIGLGRMMGSNLLILTTTGRKSGRKRRTALTNFGYDKAMGCYYVVSGFGQGSDWYRNLKADARAHFRIAGRGYDGIAESVPVDLAVQLLAQYLRRYPSIARVWPKRVGVNYDGSERALRELAAHVVVVALRPSAIRKELEPRS